MVIFPLRNFGVNCGLVLLSRFNGQWQISDFDLTSLTGLGDEVQTELRRGTEGYRAPELVSNTQSKTIPVRYSLDIWAVGCILFELWHGKQAFVDDWSTREYYQTKDQFMDDGAFTTKSHVVFSDADDTIFWREIACLTQKEPDSRPKSEKVLERVREILGFKDVAVQTDPIIVNCPPRKMFAVEDSPETWIVTDAVVSSTKTHIVTGSYDKGRYRAQLWSIGQDARLWDILLHRPMKPVIPAFSQDGQYLVFSSGGALEVMDIENLRIIWNFEPSNPPAAICILNGGDRIAYSYNNPFSTTTSPQLIINISESQQASIASSKPVDVIQSVQMSDVSVAYDPDGHYLYAIGTPENDLQTLKGYVWDLNSNRRNYIKSLTFSSGDYRESPIRAFNLSDRLHLTVLSSTPTPQNNIRTILRVYTRKGTITHQFGCGWLIFTPLLEAVFILSVGKLLYHNRDRPKFEYGDYDEEPVRACQWCPVDGPARLSDRVEDYNATGPRLPLCLWKWNGRDEKPQWVGKLTTDVIDFEAVKAFVPYGDKVKLWLENGSCVSSSHIVFDAFRSVFRKKPERKPLD